MFGLSVWELLIILVIVMLLFGHKRLGNLGSELGGAIKGFRKAVSEEDQQAVAKDDNVIDGQVTNRDAQKQNS
ncbi:MAG: twin-arginine translocase TatA/TatE family subunit [Pseudomonadota bacterium]